MEPVNDLPLSVASEEMTGYEVLKVQAHFKKDLADLGTAMLLIGVVWVYECRRAEKIVPWSDVESMTLKQLSAYFAPEPDDPDADELGKDAAPIGS